MSSRHSRAIIAVSVMLNSSVTRLKDLHGMNKEALYEEYKEWIEVDQNNIINDGVLYCEFLG